VLLTKKNGQMTKKSNGLEELFWIILKHFEKLTTLLGNCLYVVKPNEWSLTHEGIKVMNNFYLFGIIEINYNNPDKRFSLQPFLNVRILLSILSISAQVTGFLTNLFSAKIF